VASLTPRAGGPSANPRLKQLPLAVAPTLPPRPAGRRPLEGFAQSAGWGGISLLRTDSVLDGPASVLDLSRKGGGRAAGPSDQAGAGAGSSAGAGAARAKPGEDRAGAGAGGAGGATLAALWGGRPEEGSADDAGAGVGGLAGAGGAFRGMAPLDAGAAEGRGAEAGRSSEISDEELKALADAYLSGSTMGELRAAPPGTAAPAPAPAAAPASGGAPGRGVSTLLRHMTAAVLSVPPGSRSFSASSVALVANAFAEAEGGRLPPALVAHLAAAVLAQPAGDFDAQAASNVVAAFAPFHPPPRMERSGAAGDSGWEARGVLRHMAVAMQVRAERGRAGAPPARLSGAGAARLLRGFSQARFAPPKLTLLLSAALRAAPRDDLGPRALAEALSALARLNVRDAETVGALADAAARLDPRKAAPCPRPCHSPGPCRSPQPRPRVASPLPALQGAAARGPVRL